MEDRLKRRKLDALKRGVHRATGGQALPVSTHLVGIGRAGINVVAEALRRLEPGAPRLTALVVDIGEADLGPLRALADSIPPDRAAVTIVALTVPSRTVLIEALEGYPERLSIEYPRYGHKEDFRPWLPADVAIAAEGEHQRRAVAKAIYGAAYYIDKRTAEQALRQFADAIEATQSQAMIAIVFGMAGGTGSGIGVDLARHLSTCILGRRVLVAGIGVAPCAGDPPERVAGNMYALLNELDVLGDEDKSRGVVMSCGELFRNPFTAGFIMVAQDQVYQSTHDLAATQRRGDVEIATLLTTGGGTNLWELLRLLNWVAAPSTQHSAARTPWGPRWIHLLAYADTDGAGVTIDDTLLARLGLLHSYAPEFIELRVAGLEEAASVALVEAMQDALHPDVSPSIVEGGQAGSVQFILPCAGKTHLRGFAGWRAAYEASSSRDKLLDHAMLLEQGVLLSEPSTRLVGMAGASLWGESWVAVPLDDLRGHEPPPPPPKTLPSLQQLREAV